MNKEHNCARCTELKPILHNKMCSSCYYKTRRESDPEKSRTKNRKHYYKKRGKNLQEMELSNFKKNTPSKSREIRNKERQWRILKATPKWLTFEVFNSLYDFVSENMTADHIIPLDHPLVSGLNVPWNLQELTLEENRSKRKKFDGTYENESWRLEFKDLTN